MNRGFTKYFITGVRSASGAILKGGKIFKYYVYFFASLIGRAIPLINGLFPVADVRRAKILREEGQMPFVRAFGGIDTGNAFGTTLMSLFLKYMIIIGGVIAIGAIGALLFAFGLFIADFAGMWEPLILPIIFTVPAALAAVVYVIVMLITFAPVAYIVDTNKNLRATEVLTASSETMRRCGKWTCFLNIFVPLLIKGVYLGLVAACLFGFMQIDVYETRVWLSAIFALIALLVYVVFAPIFTLTTTIANNCLFEDISVDPASMNNRTKGVLIKRCNITDNLAGKGRSSNLEALFDSTPEANAAPPDTKYVPPTDTAEKLRVYSEEAQTPPEPKPVFEPIPEVQPNPVQEINQPVQEIKTAAEESKSESEPVQKFEPLPEPDLQAEPVQQSEPAQPVNYEPTPEPAQPVNPEPAPEPVQPANPEPTPEPVQEPIPEPAPEPAQPANPEPVQKFEPLPEDDLWSDLDEAWSETEEQSDVQPETPKEGNL